MPELWTKQKEIEFFNEARQFASPEQLFYLGDDSRYYAYWPKSYKGIKSTLQSIGYLMLGEVIWDKASSASPSTAWGSWLSAANPVLRDIHEYILIFCKGTFSRKRKGRENTIKKEEFLEWTKSVWTFPAVSARQIGHPAPFPEELPHRLIQLYTFKGDVVIDPFVGSGSTCLSAVKNKRNYIGYDINPDYVKLAERRIYNYTRQLRLFSKNDTG